MKNYKKHIFAGLSLVLSLTACDDFLNIDSPTTLRQDVFFRKQSDFTLAVNGLYNGLRGYYGQFYLYSDIPSDNSESNGYNNSANEMDLMTWLPSTVHFQNLWLSTYSIIARSNAVIANLQDFQMSADLKNQYLGEAAFIRALMYFNAVQFFGDIPTVTQEVKSEGEAYSYPREKVADVYGLIQEDLLLAISLLPTSYEPKDLGRVTKGASQVLLGKVYVTSRQYEKAAAVLQEVVDSDQYELLADYASVFDVNNRLNKEMVFSVYYLGGEGYGEGSNFSIAFAPFGSGAQITSGGNPAGANSGTHDLFLAFDENDLRRNTSIALFPSADSLYYTRKYLDKPIASNEGKNSWPVLRYSDALLLLAEALNENGQTNLSLGYLNKVRDRAGLPAFESLFQTENLRNAILQERRLELCFEGHRWFDLVRTGRMVETMKAYQEKYKNARGYLVANYDVQEHRNLFPIPFRELSLNPGLGQNDGY